MSNQSLLIDQSITASISLIRAANHGIRAWPNRWRACWFPRRYRYSQNRSCCLGTANTLQDLLGEDGLNPEKIAGFMLSPTELQTEELYSVNAYGSAMAPLFMNMTLWIGVFMLWSFCAKRLTMRASLTFPHVNGIWVSGCSWRPWFPFRL